MDMTNFVLTFQEI